MMENFYCRVTVLALFALLSFSSYVQLQAANGAAPRSTFQRQSPIEVQSNLALRVAKAKLVAVEALPLPVASAAKGAEKPAPADHYSNANDGVQRRFFKRVWQFEYARKGHARNPDLIAILSMSFGIAGFVIPYLGFLLAIAALVMGIKALRRGQRRGFAIAGIVLGAVVVVSYLIVFTIFLLIFALWV